MAVSLTSRLPVIAAEMRPKAALAVQKTASDLEGHAKQNAPVDTGYLQGSIQAEQVAELTSVVNVGAEYGVYVEFGTSRMAAQPYLVPAAETVRPAFIAAMKQLI